MSPRDSGSRGILYRGAVSRHGPESSASATRGMNRLKFGAADTLVRKDGQPAAADQAPATPKVRAAHRGAPAPRSNRRGQRSHSPEGSPRWPVRCGLPEDEVDDRSRPGGTNIRSTAVKQLEGREQRGCASTTGSCTGHRCTLPGSSPFAAADAGGHRHNESPRAYEVEPILDTSRQHGL